MTKSFPKQAKWSGSNSTTDTEEAADFTPLFGTPFSFSLQDIVQSTITTRVGLKDMLMVAVADSLLR